MLVYTVLPKEVIRYDLPVTKLPAVSTAVSFPAAKEVQFEVLGNDSKFSLQAVPLIEVLVVLEPLAIATNLPPAPTPVNSIASIAPVVEFTAVIVIVISLAVLAPPRLVPAIVTVSNLAYPVPAAKMSTAVYFVPFHTTVNVAAVPPPLVVLEIGVYTAKVGAYVASVYV
jgi:hypothetical protein